MRKSARVVAWIVATSLLVYFASRVDRAQLRDALATMKWGWVALAIAANSMILVSWAGLWWIVSPRAERPTYRVMFEINAMSSALMNTVPFLGGHAAAVVLMIKRGGLSRPGALSVMALDQLAEGMAKVTIFGIIALAAPLPDWMRIGIGMVCAGVGGLFVALVVAAHRHVGIRPPSEARMTLTTRARHFAASWAERMEALRSVRLSLAAYGFALGTKLSEGAALMAVQYAFGMQPSVGSTALVLGAVMLGSMLPVAPGNIGTYETAAILAFRHLGVDPATSTILAIVSHACFALPSIGIGYALGSWKLRSTVAA